MQIVLGPLSYAQKTSDRGFEAFKKNLYYPVLRKQCIACHNDNGIGPNHSSSDPWMSYQKVLSYVNFQNLSSSQFVSYGTNGHQKTYGVTVTVTKESLVQALAQWWINGEKDARQVSQSGRFLPAKQLPRSLTTSNEKYLTVEWDLGSVHRSFAGTKFKIDVRRLAEADAGHAGANQFINPRINTLGKTMRVQGIQFFLNGKLYQWAQNYGQVDKTIQEETLLSESPQIIIDEKGPLTDLISVSFDKLEFVQGAEKLQDPNFTPQKFSGQSIVSPTVPLSQISQATALTAFDESKMGVSAHFVKVKAGSFEMGSLEDDDQHISTETLHTVVISKDFEIQATSVTQAQWFLVMHQVPSFFKGKSNCDEGNYLEIKGTGMTMCTYHPVENISWREAARGFIKKINSLQNDFIYRLPTEAEWEYVAHGQLPADYRYAWGPDFDEAYAWSFNNAKNKTHQVATRLPTKVPGTRDVIYDIAGNVGQFVQDIYTNHYELLKKVDPVNCPSEFSQFRNFTDQFLSSDNECHLDAYGLFSDFGRVVRGGSFLQLERSARAASRNSIEPWVKYADNGFRLVRTPRKTNKNGFVGSKLK